VVHVSADATESGNAVAGRASSGEQSNSASIAGVAMYKARIKLDSQTLSGPRGKALTIAPGMQIVAEINQGQRTVLEYLLSPVQKTAAEAGRER
jgi:hemolysin D